ncbi:LIM domain only protein 7 [Acipenser ruthenus]|uniref:LIM domain only protein 7 n=1 Tax=Acipenser ruthenus TaxID=7906 RepID=A0A444UMV2_ACIRT|nr:LIM domain only protein 7 [Acipenser ruthenus]
MRISLNQKSNSGRDFGFIPTWSNAGVFVKSIEPGSPSELCQVQVDDEILTVNGLKVSDMDFSQWKENMDTSVKHGTLVMDIRRYGKNNWGRDLPSLPYKSHKTINMTSMDTTLVGSAEKVIHANSRDYTAYEPSEKTMKPDVNRQPVNDAGSKDMNGGFREESVTMRHKGNAAFKTVHFQYEYNLHEECKILKVNTPISSSWDDQREEVQHLQEQERARRQHEEEEQERRRQEEEQHQQRLEEKRRREEAEAQRQQAELRRQRDEEQRRQERERRQKEEEQTRREELRRKQEEEKEERQRQAAAAAEKHRREMERARQEQEQQQQWLGESYEFSKILPDASEFAVSERAKSKSTSELDDVHSDTQASNKFAEGSWTKDQSVSYAEQERQRILDEMKKKNQLLTDNSWIRQRSASVNREPASLTGTMRRGESLDNLDSPRSNSLKQPPWVTNYTASSTSSVQDSSRYHPVVPPSNRSFIHTPSTTLPASLSTGSMKTGSWGQTSSVSPTPSESISNTPRTPSQRSRSISGKKICTYCDTPLGKGAAMIIESLGLFYHLNCFKIERNMYVSLALEWQFRKLYYSDQQPSYL